MIVSAKTPTTGDFQNTYQILQKESSDGDVEGTLSEVPDSFTSHLESPSPALKSCVMKLNESMKSFLLKQTQDRIVWDSLLSIFPRDPHVEGSISATQERQSGTVRSWAQRLDT